MPPATAIPGCYRKLPPDGTDAGANGAESQAVTVFATPPRDRPEGRVPGSGCPPRVHRQCHQHPHGTCWTFSARRGSGAGDHLCRFALLQTTDDANPERSEGPGYSSPSPVLESTPRIESTVERLGRLRRRQQPLPFCEPRYEGQGSVSDTGHSRGPGNPA